MSVLNWIAVLPIHGCQGDQALFERYAAHALGLAQVEGVPDDYAIYATRVYVASEIATGYFYFGQPEHGLSLLVLQP